MTRPFDQHFPQLAARLPQRPLAALPTAVEPARRLGAALGVPALLVKRDDLSGQPYGGNKLRKLEYLLGDALARGCDSVLTFGAAGSNHALATSVYARQLGLDCHAIVSDQVQTPWVADTLRWHLQLGTQLTPAASYAQMLEVAANIRAQHPGGPERMYEIPWGGSSPLGTIGFVAAGFEIAAQLAELGVPGPVRIYVACGTMGSVAGLVLGLYLAGSDATVVAVPILPAERVSASAIVALCDAASELMHARDASVPVCPDPQSRLEFRGGFLGAGYAQATPEGLEAMQLAEALAGLKVETTYTAKALACLVADARSGRLDGAVPVFWQTLNSRPKPARLEAVDTARLPVDLRRYLQR
jgi:1-aminocyclopropane-1-carboxylate deaminase/D-cysteine desulfhydrase-like pyridoxal-dependent ACC family enzyme